MFEEKIDVPDLQHWCFFCHGSIWKVVLAGTGRFFFVRNREQGDRQHTEAKMKKHDAQIFTVKTDPVGDTVFIETKTPWIRPPTHRRITN